MDLSTSYLGLDLKHPLVPSACNPLSRDLDAFRRAEDAGASAVVMYSLFEEEIRMDADKFDFFLDFGSESFAEAVDYFPQLRSHAAPVERYFEVLEEASAALDIPVIGSLNCVSVDGWAEYAPRFEQAGAAALELNIYSLVGDAQRSGPMVERLYTEIVEETRRRVKIPLSVKLHPFFSSLPNIAAALQRKGADGLVLFNRFYQPDLDIETLEVDNRLVLSTSRDMLLPLRWIAILYGRVPVDLALTTGVHSHVDVLKGILAGASVTMMAAELLQHGLGRIEEIRLEMERWLEEHEYESLKQMQGAMSQQHVLDPSAFERAHHMSILRGYSPDPTGVAPIRQPDQGA